MLYAGMVLFAKTTGWGASLLTRFGLSTSRTMLLDTLSFELIHRIPSIRCPFCHVYRVFE